MARPPAVPKNVEWYLDGVKWLIVISAGAIGFGLSLLEKTGLEAAYLTFAGYGLLLAATAVAGMLYLFNMYYYVGLREAGKPTTDSDVTAYKTRADGCYAVVAWTFGLGMLAFAGFGGIYVYDVYTRSQAHEAKVVALGGQGVDLALYQKGEHAWILRREKDGRLAWQRFALP